MRRVILTLLVLMTSIIVGVSQENPPIPKDQFKIAGEEIGFSIDKKLVEGDSFYKKGLYERAYRAYLDLFELNKNLPTLNYKMGISALYGGKADEALSYFLLMDTAYTSDHYYQYGKALQAVMDYKKADEAYQKYFNSLNSWQRRHFKKEYEQLMRECEFGANVVGDSVPCFIINMGPATNSYYDEYAAVEFIEGKQLYYTTRRPDKTPTNPVHRNSQYERIKKAELTYGEAMEGENIKQISASGHYSVAGWSEDNQVLYVYSGKRKNGQIKAAYYYKDKFKRPRRLKGAVNRKAFKFTTISVSNKGEAYFVSDRPGGEGGKDIWTARKKGKYRFSKPVNLGSLINTPYDEEAVYITPDGKNLYFSSNGHPGYGGYDIYKSEKQIDDTWGEPVNLGYPINSPADDMFYFPSSDSLVAFFSSERPEGYGGLDIYKIIKDVRTPFSLWGEVIDQGTGEILTANVTLVDFVHNYPVAVTVSDSLSGEYYLDVDDVGNYVLQVDVAGYRTVIDTLEMPTKRNSRIRKDYYLEKLSHPYTIWGNITDQKTGNPIQAEILIKPENEDSATYRVFTNRVSGYYSITLEDKKNIEIEVVAKDYYSQILPLNVDEMSGEREEKSFELLRSIRIYTLTGIVQEENTRNPVQASFRITKPGETEEVSIIFADSISGRYHIEMEDVGPYLVEVNADGYFYLNIPVHFNPDSTLQVKNITMQKMSMGTKIVIENILFTTGQSTLRAESYPELNKLVRLLKENETVRIEVSGHTDNVGSAALNRKLSRERAFTVKNYLESQGIEPSRIEYEGYGFDRPIESNNTAEGRAANRRVEIEVLE